MSDQNVAPEATPAAPAEATPVAAPPAVPAAPDAPWTKDLLEMFPDEAERGRVDSFMREKYQPYVTNLETESKPARELYEALQGEDSLETYLGVAEQLYGSDVADLLAEAIVNGYQAAEAEAPAAPAEPAAAEPSELDPRVQALLDEREAEEAKASYWAEMKRVQEADSRVDPDLFHPFVAATGDFDEALGQYLAWHAKAYPAGPPEPAAQVPAPPATLGTDGVGGPTPPAQKRYDSIDSAMDDFLADVRSSRNPPPSTVGSA